MRGRSTTSKIAIIIVVVIVAIILTYLTGLLLTGAGAPRAISLNESLLSMLPNTNFSMSETSIATTGTLRSAGYLSVQDEIFTNRNMNLSNSTIVTFTLMHDKNSSVANRTLDSELLLANSSYYSSGSFYSLINRSTVSLNGTNTIIYELLDVGVFNNSKAELTQNNGIPLMPDYQYTSAFVYGDYYGSVTIDSFVNSSTYAIASMSLARYLIDYIQKPNDPYNI